MTTKGRDTPRQAYRTAVDSTLYGSNRRHNWIGGVDVTITPTDNITAPFALDLQIDGGTRSTRGVTADTTATTSDSVIFCNPEQDITVALPTAVGITGKVYDIRNASVFEVTVDPDGTETINGATTKILIQYNSITVISDGNNWAIL